MACADNADDHNAASYVGVRTCAEYIIGKHHCLEGVILFLPLPEAFCCPVQHIHLTVGFIGLLQLKQWWRVRVLGEPSEPVPPSGYMTLIPLNGNLILLRGNACVLVLLV
jgi:hypothetical protein